MTLFSNLIRLLWSKDKTINFNEVNNGQRTALHFASLFGDYNIARLILLHGKYVGFNFNAKTSSEFKEYPNDCTAYIYACYNKDLEMVNLFKAHAEACKIDLNAKDKDGHDGAFYLAKNDCETKSNTLCLIKC